MIIVGMFILMLEKIMADRSDVMKPEDIKGTKSMDNPFSGMGVFNGTMDRGIASAGDIRNHHLTLFIVSLLMKAKKRKPVRKVKPRKFNLPMAKGNMKKRVIPERTSS